jgi:hypothetical protein
MRLLAALPLPFLQVPVPKTDAHDLDTAEQDVSISTFRGDCDGNSISSAESRSY